MKKLIIAVVVLSQLGGCAAMQKSMEEARARQVKAQSDYESTMPTCSALHECDTLMGNAQAWVSQHSQMQIATATNSIIETYRSGSTVYPWFNVVKTPIGAGKYKIIMTSDCQNFYELGADFNKFVGNK